MMNFNKVYLPLFALMIYFIAISFIYRSNRSTYENKSLNQIDLDDFLPSVLIENTTNLPTSKQPDTIVNSAVLFIYVYINNHEHAFGNLKYFIDTAVRERDGVDYVFILQQRENETININEMPPLPKSNAAYIPHENICYDFGTFGWFFQKYALSPLWKSDTGTMINSSDKNDFPRRYNISDYKYFIFMNSSARGPFLPPYLLDILSHSQIYRWYHIFTERISDKVKLVGCTIACDGRPHVQSYFFVTDTVGLTVLFQTGDKGGIPRVGVFRCHGVKDHVVWFSEMETSIQIMEAGYSIDCLLSKYQSMHLSKNTTHRCTARGSPYINKNLDGISLEPYEVVFVKYNNDPNTSDGQQRAKLYQQWMQDTKETNRTSW